MRTVSLVVSDEGVLLASSNRDVSWHHGGLPCEAVKALLLLGSELLTRRDERGEKGTVD